MLLPTLAEKKKKTKEEGKGSYVPISHLPSPYLYHSIIKNEKREKMHGLKRKKKSKGTENYFERARPVLNMPWRGVFTAGGSETRFFVDDGGGGGGGEIMQEGGERGKDC